MIDAHNILFYIVSSSSILSQDTEPDLEQKINKMKKKTTKRMKENEKEKKHNSITTSRVGK